jgi:hypothetical protein
MTGPGPDWISLREYIERILQEHEKAHDTQHAAVGIAAKELERRLGILNHAHEQSVADRADFVTRDKFETRALTVDNRMEEQAKAMDARLKDLESFRSRATGAAVALSLFAGAIGAAIARAIA